MSSWITVEINICRRINPFPSPTLMAHLVEQVEEI